MEWIKIIDDETLPKAPCLAYWNDGKYTVLADQNDCDYAEKIIGGRYTTHWMPCPEPPKEK